MNWKKKQMLFYTALLALACVIIMIGFRFGAVIGSRMAAHRSAKVNLVELWNSGDYLRALSVSEAALQKNPLDPLALAFSGFASYYLGFYSSELEERALYMEQAIFNLRKRLNLKREQAYLSESAYILGKAYHSKGPAYANLVLRYMDMAQEGGYWNEDISEYLGLAYIQLNRYEEGIQHFLKAGENQKNSNFYFNLAEAFALAQKPIEAESYYNKAIRESKDDNLRDKARFQLAKLYYRLGRYEESKELYTAFLEKFPDSSEAYYNLGEIYSIQKDEARARAAWSAAVRLDPLNRDAYIRLYSR